MLIMTRRLLRSATDKQGGQDLEVFREDERLAWMQDVEYKFDEAPEVELGAADKLIGARHNG